MKTGLTHSLPDLPLKDDSAAEPPPSKLMAVPAVPENSGLPGNGIAGFLTPAGFWAGAVDVGGLNGFRLAKNTLEAPPL